MPPARMERDCERRIGLSHRGNDKIGRGVEPWDDEFVLANGTTCALELSHQKTLRQDIVLVTDDAPELLT